jgi:hypothetical protein
MSDLGYVSVDRLTLREAEERTLANAQSCVVRHAEVERASDRARRLAGKQRSNVLPMGTRRAER